MTASEHNNDDESVLDPSEQLNRPPDTAFNQQRILAWAPILDPRWVIVGLFYMGIIMVPVGFKIDSIQENVVELKVTYDGVKDPVCGIGEEFNANLKSNNTRFCLVNLTAPQDMSPPIYIHYELTNFYQNHRNYYTSRDANQLLGKVGGQSKKEREDCEPLNTLGQGDDQITLNPCGLIANTFFNDKFILESGRDIYNQSLIMREDGIAWGSDIEYMYQQPNGFKYEECNCTDCCTTDEWSCTTPYRDEDGTCFQYFYPNDNTTQYLYETYPDIISPIEGVTNEHFIVWMRIATQPTFRKLYGWIDQPIAKGQLLVFRINPNYVVTRFGGTKSLIVGTTSIFGGRNEYFSWVFKGVGFFCLAAGFFFAVKHWWRPRKLGDPSYLHYKEE